MLLQKGLAVKMGAGIDAAAAKPRNDGSLIRVTTYFLQMTLDILVLIASFNFASFLRFGHLARGDSRDWILLLVPVFLLIGFYSNLYTLDSMRSLRLSMKRLTAAVAWALAIVIFGFFATKSTDTVSRLLFFSGALISITFLLLIRIPIYLLVDRVIGKRFLRKLFIIDGTASREIEGYDVITCANLGLKLDLHDPIVLHALSGRVKEYDRVLVDCPVEDREKWSLFLQAAGCIGSLLIPELRSVVSDHTKFEIESTSIRVSAGPLDLRSRAVKRIFDLSLALAICVLIAPLLLAVAIAIKLDTKGPVLFKQIRMGRGNRLFYVYKFRSMRDDSADMNGMRSASKDDDRITRVGRFIRATSIDELPQLFNVLIGNMSMVGPRPHALGSKAGEDLFWQIDVRYWLRHSAKPGITGLAQVRGFRGATDTRHDLTERLRYDLEYLRNWSMFRDIAILMATFGVVMHKNAY
ncbi:exopolysaccharide biosynthesis polyprenyl glycosylphosphotransferase [Sphingobium sp. AS12]|uniref:exopolysaccharide biosynthesis polyprenyl glycosylphosphotransferase n=1 Tax=Sphingobium sp. AS12 TaxID=2849495 RepID=UPI0020C83CE7|nr:exopolysaccharide biosynthesis polyprenyl glycosylphosphotransferase [Sphingobium sp. AS12]